MNLSSFNRLLTYFFVGSFTLILFVLFPPSECWQVTNTGLMKHFGEDKMAFLGLFLLPVGVFIGVLSTALRSLISSGLHLAIALLSIILSWLGKKAKIVPGIETSGLRTKGARAREVIREKALRRFWTSVAHGDLYKSRVHLSHFDGNTGVFCRFLIESRLLGCRGIALPMLLNSEWDQARGLLIGCLQMAYHDYVEGDFEPGEAYDLREAPCFKRLESAMSNLLQVHKEQKDVESEEGSKELINAEKSVEDAVTRDDDLDGFAMAMFSRSANGPVIQRWVRIRGSYQIAMGFGLTSLAWLALMSVNGSLSPLALVVGLVCVYGLVRYGLYQKLLSVRYVARTAMLEIAARRGLNDRS